MTKKVIYQVDAFTDQPFRGNPACVCIIENEMSDAWMQNVAMEMNLSETAFILKSENGFIIRFFSPVSEIPLCGHATLSSAHILFDEGFVSRNEKINFKSKAGDLVISSSGSWIKMNFPAYEAEKMKIPADFEKIAGIDPAELHRTAHGWVIALLKNEKEVRNLNPDFRLMKKSEFGDLIVTAPSDDNNFDFCVRCFAPALGIDEDPVTGSAHCALAPFWNHRTGKKDFISHQVSKREGVLKVELKKDRVEVSGQAITVIRGELFV
jgi:PhzF family phenazine biosynthesis protein